MRQFLAVFGMFTGGLFVTLMMAPLDRPILPRDIETAILVVLAVCLGISMKS